MLRYDNSHPATKEDEAWIREASTKSFLDQENTTELMLESYLAPWIRQDVVKANLFPTHERWHSFDWQVTEVYPVERIPFNEVPEERRPPIR
jgi:hypothetical protein